MAYIGNDLRSNEDYKIIDDISSGFNGSATSFALQVGGSTPVPFPKFEQQLLISVNGVIQEPDPTGSAGFKLSGTNIVFSSAPTNGHAFFGVIYAGADYVNAGGAFPDGSINFPSITFGSDTNTGFTRIASGTVALISDGTKVAQFPTSQGSSGQALITDGAGNLSFGAVSVATSVTVADESSDTTCFPLFATAATGNLGPKSGSNLTFNSNTGVLTATSFAGDGSNLTGLTTDLVNDTSPQLGGNLDVNTKNIVFGDSAGTTDDRLTFGAGDDLKIYSDGTNGILEGGGSGGNAPLFLNANTIRLQTQTGGEKYIDCQENGAVELYHNNSKKFETTSGGATLTGNLIATGNLNVNDNGNINVGNSGDLQLFHNGTNSFVDSDTGNLVISSVADLRFNSADYKFMNVADNETLARFVQDGQVELYYDNSKKLETTSSGITISGSQTINGTTIANGHIRVRDHTGTEDGQIMLGTGNDFRLYHDGANSLTFFDAQVGSVRFRTDVGNSARSNIILSTGVDLYYNNVKRFETTSAGIDVTGRVTADDLTIENTSGNLSAFFTATNGLGTLEVGGSTGAFIDLKTPASDDFDIRFDASGTITSKGNINLNVNGNESGVHVTANGSVDLYNDNVKRFNTNSSGAKVHGNSGNIFEASCATNSTASILFQNTEANTSGDIRILLKTATNQGSDPYIKFDAGGNDMIVGTLYAGGANNKLVLGHGNSPSGGVIGLHIDGNGQITPDSNNARDLGNSSLRFRNIYTNDLNLSNEGSSNDVDGTWGNYTIQEGAEDLFLINRRNGKKFKFNLMEVA